MKTDSSVYLDRVGFLPILSTGVPFHHLKNIAPKEGNEAEYQYFCTSLCRRNLEDLSTNHGSYKKNLVFMQI